MNIVLTGFMGTGKTTVGRLLADKLNFEFVDVDERIQSDIEEFEGKSIASIFRDSGEDAFRRAESAIIEQISSGDNQVIATGGGALMNPKNREHLEKSGLLVCLRAQKGTLLDRLKDDVTRPLLAGEELAARIERLMKEREGVYALCPIQIATDNKTIEKVVQEILLRVR